MNDIVNNHKPICPVCNKEIELDQVVNHHISYFPEKTIPVHRSCHSTIHHSNKFPHLKPKKGEAEKFYSKNKPNKLKEPITIDLKEYFTDDQIESIIDETNFYPIPEWLFRRKEINSSTKILYAYFYDLWSKARKFLKLMLSIKEISDKTGLDCESILNSLEEMAKYNLAWVIINNFNEVYILLCKHKWQEEYKEEVRKNKRYLTIYPDEL